MGLKLKRVYETVEKNDGYRILIDRIWPRGVSKEAAKIDWWDKDIAPSTKLREWFGHILGRFAEFGLPYSPFDFTIVFTQVINCNLFLTYHNLINTDEE